MKMLFLSATWLLTLSVFGQNTSSKIDSSNYYDYYSTDNVMTNWLRMNDVVPIFMEELKNAGFDPIYDYTLYTLKTGEKLVLAVYCSKSDFGFVYEEGHTAFPFPNIGMRRKAFSRLQGANYYYSSYKPGGKADWTEIKKLPNNIFLFDEDCYWFQYGGNTNKILITKEIAIEILRQDIRKALSLIHN